MFKAICTVLLITALSATFIYGDSSKEDKDETPVIKETVEVVGKVEVKKALQSVTIISRKDIEAKGQENVKEILNHTPGIFTTSNGTAGQSSSTYIRGSKTTQILYIVDGVKMRDNSSLSGPNLSTMSSEMIDTMEVVRGPLSSIYGSDAMGGVINIRTNTRDGISLKTSAGSHGSYSGAFTANGSKNNFYYGITSNYRKYSDDLPNDTFKGTGISAKLGYQNTVMDAGIRFFGDFSKSGIPINSGKQALNRKYNKDHFIIAAPLSFKVSENSSLKFTASYNKGSYKFEDSDDQWNPYFKSRSNVWELDAQYVMRADIFKLTAGADYSGEKIDSENQYGTQIDGKKSHYFSGYLNTNIDLEELNIFASLRFDKYKNVKSNLSPQIGLSYLFSNKFKLRASFSMSFKAPMLIQQVNVWGAPNFDLNPEKATSFEIGAEYYSGIFTVSTTWFSTRYKDMIGWVTIDPVTYTGQYQNIEKVNASGIEIGAAIKPVKALTFNLTYTYLDTEDKQNGTPLLRRPEHVFTASGIYTHKHFTAAVSMNWVGKRPDKEYQGWTAVDVNNPAYSTFNAKLTVPVSTEFSVFGKVSNLFDKKYSEIIGYPSPGRRVEMGIKYSIR